MDALISIVLVIMILGTVSATSESLRSEIASMVGWYERANIADNMLDVLTKSPGEPEDWEIHAKDAQVIGLRSPDEPHTIDYEKLMALNSSLDDVKEKLMRLAEWKDFMIETFVSSFNISIEGRFPRVYIENMTFSNPNGNPPGINFEISGEPGNTAFTVSYVEIVREGRTYINNEICTLKNGNNIDLEEGDRVKFVLAQDVTLTAKRGNYEYVKELPSGTVVDIYITGEEVSNFKINFGGGSCPYSFKFSGKGNVVVTVSAYDNQTPKIKGEYTFASILETLDEPTYRWAVINGSIFKDQDIISNSMNNSPWINMERRIVTVGRLEYNLSAPPSAETPMVYGTLGNFLPDSAYFRVNVPDSGGNMSFVIISGPKTRGLFIYKEKPEENLKAVLIREDEKIVLYSGTTTSISIPVKDLFGDPQIGDTIGMWFYSLDGWNREEDVKIEFIHDLKWALKPRLDTTIIRLHVWDEP
nr:hypothetical protein [Thermococcus sp. JdF3]